MVQIIFDAHHSKLWLQNLEIIFETFKNIVGERISVTTDILGTFLFFPPSPHCSVSSIKDLRTRGHWFNPGLANILPED